MKTLSLFLQHNQSDQNFPWASSAHVIPTKLSTVSLWQWWITTPGKYEELNYTGSLERYQRPNPILWPTQQRCQVHEKPDTAQNDSSLALLPQQFVCWVLDKCAYSSCMRHFWGTTTWNHSLAKSSSEVCRRLSMWGEDLDPLAFFTIRIQRITT